VPSFPPGPLPLVRGACKQFLAAFSQINTAGG
jgi:hypothetical protein